MAKKSDKAEIDRRIHAVVKLFSSAKTNSYILRFCAEEWGYRSDKPKRTCNAQGRSLRLTTQSNALIFLGTRLALLEEIIEASIRCKQHSNAVGALKLQAQLTRLLEGS